MSNIEVDFGRHKGELITRVPLSYLRFMINNRTRLWEKAKAELDRRGGEMPKMELSGHAIDRASLRVMKIYRADRKEFEGLYSWLQRVSLEAIEHDMKTKEEAYLWKGMKFIINKGEEFPTLKTIMRM